MAVRLRVELRSAKGRSTAAAIANSGFETRDPEVAVPLRFAARRLKLDVARAPDVQMATPGGDIPFKDLGFVWIRVMVADRRCRAVRARAIGSAAQREVLLNDKLLGALGIDLAEPGAGRWRFRDEASQTERESERPELW